MATRSICGVILAARDPERLARFYAEALELDFEREDHGGLDTHFGVDLGSVHFGIHPPQNLDREAPGNGAAVIAFAVDSLAAAIARLDGLGARQLRAPHDEGFGPVASYADPEGNAFEIVELTYEFDA